MKQINEIIIVEGRYDKNTVSQVVCGTILETSGYCLLKNKDKIKLLRKLAEKNGLIILTDSDKAGFFIRGRLHGMLGDLNIKHAYIPDIYGHEKRKNSPSKEGKLGVEGMTKEVILKSLELAGATFFDTDSDKSKEELITKTDLFSVGLSGCAGSAQKRQILLSKLELPERLSANALLDILNILYTRDEFLALDID